VPSSESEPEVVTFQVEVDTDVARLFTDKQPALWPEATTDEREAIIDLVAIALRHLSEHIPEWLPQAVVARTSTRFAVTIAWENGLIQEDVLRRRRDAEANRQERVADLLRMSQTTSE
jgi:hypothetical protein